MDVRFKFRMTNGALGDIWHEHFSADEMCECIQYFKFLSYPNFSHVFFRFKTFHRLFWLSSSSTRFYFWQYLLAPLN